jgi:hypothetical protein
MPSLANAYFREVSQPISHASAETDGGGIIKIQGRAGDFPHIKSEIKSLAKHLVVEHKIIGVFQ